MQPKHSTWYINSLSFSILYSLPSLKFSSSCVTITCCIAITLLGCNYHSRSFFRIYIAVGSYCSYYFATNWIRHIKPMKKDLSLGGKSKYRFPGNCRKLLASHCQSGSMPIFLNNCCGQGKLLIGSSPNHTVHLEKSKMLYQTIWTK